jgi:hypothetical protein
MARPEVTGRKINRAGKSISEFCHVYDNWHGYPPSDRALKEGIHYLRSRR